MELYWNFPYSKTSKMEAKMEVKPESLKYLRSVPLSGEMHFYSKPYAKFESIRQKLPLVDSYKLIVAVIELLKDLLLLVT